MILIQLYYTVYTELRRFARKTVEIFRWKSRKVVKKSISLN